jgi:hypothetical protein
MRLSKCRGEMMKLLSSMLEGQLIGTGVKVRVSMDDHCGDGTIISISIHAPKHSDAL